MKMLKSNLMAVLTVLLLPLYAAAVPNYINYQGRLVDNNGNPMSGSKAVTFRICDTLAGACSATCSVGNTCLWDEPQTVTLENGIFSVKLGSVDPLTSAVYAADDRFLEVVVDAVTLAPRVQLVSVPFALSAGNITSATGVSISTYITVAGHVTASKFYGDGSALTGLGAGAIADGSITTAKLADNAITTIKITDANVTTAKIADSNVTDAKIASLSASKLTGSVPATHVDLSTVTAALGTKLANTVTVPVTLVDLSTVTTALGGKISTGGDGSSLLGISSVALAGFYDDAAVRARLGLGIGSAVQAWDTDLDDLLDGSLSGSKVGSGVPAGNIASGTLGSGVISSSIAFNAMYTQSICAAGQVLKAAAGAWACGTDETGAGGTVTGAGLAGQLSYWATGSSLSGSNSLFWDTVNFRLGIGNATPSSALHVTGDITVSGNVDGRDVSADATTLTNHVANVTNPHSVTKTQVGLSNVTNDAQIPLVQKAAANGVAALNADSKLNTDYLAGTIVSTHVVDGSIAAADLASGVFDIGNFTSGSLNGDLLGATIVSTNIVNGTIADADIAAGAAIAKSKLASLAIVNADVDGAAAIAYSKLSLANSVVTGDIFDGTIANGDLAASGFDLTKFTAGSLNGDLLGATIVSTNIVNGTIADADIAAGAAIAKSKLASLAIVNADVDGAAAIAYSKLSLANSVVTGDIFDGTIANGDLAASGFDLTKFTAGSLNGDLLGATIVSTNIVNGTIADADIAAGAAIAKSKLASLAIVNADVDGAAAIAYSKLSLANSVVTGDIFDGTIANGDLAASGFDLTKFTAGSLNGDLLGATIVSTNIVNVGMDKLVQTPVTIVQAAYTVTSTDTVVYADCTAATVAITLPAATASNIGKEIYLYRVDGSLNDVTFAADAGDSIVGGAASPLAAADQWKYVRFIVYDEATWIANKSN